jgi:hypothetical protein
MTAMDPELIKNEINRFRAVRAKLEKAIAPSNKEAAEQVISFAYEFGVYAAVQEVMKGNNPTAVTAARQNAQALAQILGSIIAITDRLDWLVSQHNDEAAESDPAHERIFMHFDRGFTIDHQKRIVTYLDDPSNPRPLQLSVVHTRDQPGPGRALRLVQQGQRTARS